MFKQIIIALAAVFLGSSLSAGERWVRGAFVLHSLEGEVSLGELGQESFSPEPSDLPFAMGGLLVAGAKPGSHILLSASNRVFMEFRGEGSFRVERFEQIMPEEDAWRQSEEESGQSRMLVFLRSGQLFIDNRATSDASQHSVETPIGRVSGGLALWQIRISHDPRNDIFNFEISCSDGRLRFTDNRGENYVLRGGQRLTGAGGRMNPGIEVVDVTNADRQAMQGFIARRENVRDLADGFASYAASIEPMVALPNPEQDIEEAAVGVRAVRRVVIEHAPRTDSLVPFRGEIPPPRGARADLF
ncbi:MAG: hypothetical protein EA353_10475 [Puniceicoccaceae bacterium]|nr:MAG: hypothetical protein EA353_10475 [Puniceicoccaceae bacterium]